MPQRSTHPSDEELSAYSLGQLPQERLVVIDSHISECEPCCETIVGLSSDDTFVALLKEARRIPTDQTLDDDGSTAASSSSSAEVPAALAEHPRYEIVGLIGKGGMGDVYQARHRMMERAVALKVIKHELVRRPEAVDRFHREVTTAAHLSHPNIVTAYDAEQAGDVHFLVMEFVDGVDLSQTVKDRGALPIADACDYVRQAAIGLQHAHEQGMVHRDIKPHNLMVTADGTVKILDFGLASLAPETSPNSETAGTRGDLTAAGAIMGTPDFISPEQADDAHQADIRSDIYSLGATLYFLLSGRPPFVDGTVMQKLKSHAQAEPEPLESLRKEIPESLAAVVSRMIAKNPDDRFQTPTAVAEALLQASSVAQPETPAKAPRRSNRGIMVGLSLSGFAAVAFAAMFFAQESVADKLASMKNPVTRVEPSPPDTVPVTLYTVDKDALDGQASAAICDIGPCRIALLGQDIEKTRDVIHRLDVHVSGEPADSQTVTTSKRAQYFDYTYAAGEADCRFFDFKFRIANGMIHIGDHSYVLGDARSPGQLILIDKNSGRTVTQTMKPESERTQLKGSWKNKQPVVQTLKTKPVQPTKKPEKPMTAGELVVQMSKKHGHLVPKLQQTISEAAGIPNAQWQKFEANPNAATDAIKGEPLSLVLWKLNPLQESIKNLLVLKDFQHIGGAPKPKQLSDAMFPSHVYGYFSMIQPHYISGLTYDLGQGSRRLNGNFRFQAPNLYAGKVNFVVTVDADFGLQVTEFTLPNYGITLVRGEDGLWKRADVAKIPAGPPKTPRVSNQIKSLKRALDIYKIENAVYPSTEEGLKALVQKPGDKNRTKNWTGSYLKGARLPNDPWGHPYAYEFPGKRGEKAATPDIWSLGPDGKSNTSDDIGNWPEEESDPETDRSVDELIDTLNELGSVLDQVKDGATAKLAAPDVKKLSQRIQQQIEVLTGSKPQPFGIAPPNVQQCRDINQCLTTVGNKASQLRRLQDDDVSKLIGNDLSPLRKLSLQPESAE